MAERGIENCLQALGNIEGAIQSILELVKPGLSPWDKAKASLVLFAKISYLVVDLAKSMPELSDLDDGEVAVLTTRLYGIVKNIVTGVQGKLHNLETKLHAALVK